MVPKTDNIIFTDNVTDVGDLGCSSSFYRQTLQPQISSTEFSPTLTNNSPNCSNLIIANANCNTHKLTTRRNSEPQFPQLLDDESSTSLPPCRDILLENLSLKDKPKYLPTTLAEKTRRSSSPKPPLYRQPTNRTTVTTTATISTTINHVSSNNINCTLINPNDFINNNNENTSIFIDDDQPKEITMQQTTQISLDHQKARYPDCNLGSNSPIINITNSKDSIQQQLIFNTSHVFQPLYTIPLDPKKKMSIANLV